MIRDEIKTEPLKSETLSTELSLANLSLGVRATITELRGTEDIQDALARVGFVAGVDVRLISQGESPIICIGTSRIGIRREMLEAVLVELQGLIPSTEADGTDSL